MGIAAAHGQAVEYLKGYALTLATGGVYGIVEVFRHEQDVAAGSAR